MNASTSRIENASAGPDQSLGSSAARQIEGTVASVYGSSRRRVEDHQDLHWIDPSPEAHDAVGDQLEAGAPRQQRNQLGEAPPVEQGVTEQQEGTGHLESRPVTQCRQRTTCVITTGGKPAEQAPQPSVTNDGPSIPFHAN